MQSNFFSLEVSRLNSLCGTVSLQEETSQFCKNSVSLLTIQEGRISLVLEMEVKFLWMFTWVKLSVCLKRTDIGTPPQSLSNSTTLRYMTYFSGHKLCLPPFSPFSPFSSHSDIVHVCAFDIDQQIKSHPPLYKENLS
jgi:hypothetical protein